MNKLYREVVAAGIAKRLSTIGSELIGMSNRVDAESVESIDSDILLYIGALEALIDTHSTIFTLPLTRPTTEV